MSPSVTDPVDILGIGLVNQGGSREKVGRNVKIVASWSKITKMFNNRLLNSI